MNNDTLEKIYTDFSEKFLPKLGEGLMITKDYFQDLFGRYVKYLIIVDSLSIFLAIAGLIVGIILAKKAYKLLNEQENDSDFAIGAIFAGIGALAIIISPIVAIVSTADLVKDLTVPEIRVYEELVRNKN